MYGLFSFSSPLLLPLLLCSALCLSSSVHIFSFASIYAFDRPVFFLVPWSVSAFSFFIADDWYSSFSLCLSAVSFKCSLLDVCALCTQTHTHTVNFNMMCSFIKFSFRVSHAACLIIGSMCVRSCVVRMCMRELCAAYVLLNVFFSFSVFS